MSVLALEAVEVVPAVPFTPPGWLIVAFVVGLGLYLLFLMRRRGVKDVHPLAGVDRDVHMPRSPGGRFFRNSRTL